VDQSIKLTCVEITAKRTVDAVKIITPVNIWNKAAAKKTGNAICC